MKSGNLKFLELCGPLQARNGTALPFLYQILYIAQHYVTVGAEKIIY